MERATWKRWRRIEALIDAALDAADGDTAADARADRDVAAGVPAGEDVRAGTRADAAELELSGDPDIRAEAARLLGYRERVRGFMVRPVLEAAPELAGDEDRSLREESAPAAPERIGRYCILHEVGRGGMGVVYLAERDDPQLRQRVAIKVLHDGIASRSLVRRFVRERQILVSLSHPGIARLLDGGVTDDGLPWFAMEYVDGVPITRYCDARRLDVDARLELFLRVCDAVRYAHRSLVVHRDLKPSNILVTEPAAGEPFGAVKLLDFGIARPLESEADGARPVSDDATLTRAGLVPLTPEYASPEQLRGVPVSTASDVYQLGVLLYELLTGRRPHRVAGLSLHEVHRTVMETPVTQPSAAVARQARVADRNGTALADRSSVSLARASTPRRLSRRLRGDLDTIASMAMRTDPERRYASVEQLAADVRRHLERAPIEARPDAILYRAGRFVLRHRVGVAAVAVIFVLLAVFATAMTVQADRLARERDRATRATAFLADLFEALEPVEAGGTTVSVTDVLARGVERARAELNDQPLLQARILEVIGGVYELQGRHEEAEPLLHEALATRVATLGPNDIEVGEGSHRLAALSYERGNYAQAESLYRDALAVYRRRGRADDLQAVQARMGLALVQRARGSYDAADSTLREVLATPGIDADSSFDGPTALLFLGRLRTRAADFDEAELLIRESLARREALLGRVHPSVANALDALGELMLERGDPAAAESLFLDALAMRDTVYRADHTDIASGLAYLARARLARGDLTAPDTLLARALPIFTRAFGARSPDVADALEHLAEARAARGDLAAADSLFRQALAIWRGMPLEPTHDRPATLLVRLGALRLRRGSLDDGCALLHEGLGLRERSLPAGHLRIAEARVLIEPCGR